jgi:aspartate aminotransferase-like enzyme
VRARVRDEHGVIVAGGQGQLKGQIIRVGHLGYVTDEDINIVLGALRKVIVQ